VRDGIGRGVRSGHHVTKQGQGGSVVQGSAGTRGSNAPEGLERCDKPMGAVAVVEPQDQILGYLRS
jgi:hypothetical protein